MEFAFVSFSSFGLNILGPLCLWQCFLRLPFTLLKILSWSRLNEEVVQCREFPPSLQRARAHCIRITRIHYRQPSLVDSALYFIALCCAGALYQSNPTIRLEAGIHYCQDTNGSDGGTHCTQMIHLSFVRTESYCIDKMLSNKTEKCPPVAEILLNPVGLLLVSVIVSHCGCLLLSARVRSNKWSSDFLYRQASCSREIHPL